MITVLAILEYRVERNSKNNKIPNKFYLRWSVKA
jgi:hypothetical protein